MTRVSCMAQLTTSVESIHVSYIAVGESIPLPEILRIDARFDWCDCRMAVPGERVVAVVHQ